MHSRSSMTLPLTSRMGREGGEGILLCTAGRQTGTCFVCTTVGHDVFSVHWLLAAIVFFFGALVGSVEAPRFVLLHYVCFEVFFILVGRWWWSRKEGEARRGE
ncbi:hypothetical protein GMDG_08072 [Pseudogymnoascus destructans 20631-21]|uniref:Uncharacterized protein n=1 Tax=Pseudogymnoascus destructans (strain ATCC MYA-4855 / 20631-21) TaxID=658429 RepID=L8G1E8_PSED2|nr:hypothetical protein GMDG_08072 [Pseudogymnoascus destructans 20631-21]